MKTNCLSSSEMSIVRNGTRDRARTCDLRLRRALLFQLSYSCLLLSQYHTIFASFNIIVLATTYSHTSTRCTTIGTSWLNFCVRDGNRCTSAVIITKTLTLNEKNKIFVYLLLIICTVKVSQ